MKSVLTGIGPVRTEVQYEPIVTGDLRVTRRSLLTRQYNTMELPITEAQIQDWANGVLVQVAMPQLSRELREFLISGATPQEWGAEFGQEEEQS